VAQPVSQAALKISLAQEFARSTVADLSPDGKKVCLEDWAERGYPLRVLEVGTWQPIYGGRFQSRTLSVSFFADSQTLLVGSLGSLGTGVCGVGKGNNCTVRETAIDLRTGERAERTLPLALDRGETYWATSAGALLDAHFEQNPQRRTETLALVEFPSFRETVKVAYATQPRKPIPARVGSVTFLTEEYGFGISGDRKTIAYSFDDVLVCRRTKDLEVLWTRQIEERVKAFKVAISAHGGRVAAVIADVPFAHLERESYVRVYDGETGADVALLPLRGTDGIALSPDGNLVAVAVREPGTNGKVVPTVHIYEVSSGQEVASVAHDRVKNGRHQFLEAACTVAFTSDGEYLVTSGMTTKVWKLG
jgi:hypothetical protein